MMVEAEEAHVSIGINLGERLSHQIRRGKGRPPKRTQFKISGEIEDLGLGSMSLNTMEHELVSKQLLGFTDGSV
jgi:hypothetical protein